MLLGVGYPVRNVDAAATLPTNPHPLVEFVKINMTGEHEQTCCYEFFAAPVLAGAPCAGDGSGALCPDVVAALRHLLEMINQRLQSGPSGGKQGFAMQGRRRGSGRLCSFLSVTGTGQARSKQARHHTTRRGTAN
jgi:hypothetical protein